MPLPFTKPEGLIGRFAVVKPWPDVQAAEDENIARLQITAQSLGLECIVVDPEGVRLDHPDQRVTSRDVDFVIHLHFETPKAYDAFSFVALWNPLRFFKDWGYRRYSKNLLTHDDFLSCSSTWADNHVRRMIANDPVHLPPHFTMYHSLSEPIFEPTLGEKKIFYAGINWDKLGKKKGRHQDLLKLLDQQGVLRIHGPRVFHNVNVWEGYRCYVGPVPFDGVSMIHAISRAGIALVFSSDAHKESELMSNRLFESLAAGSVIICDDNPFARRHLGDLLFYVDTTEPLEQVHAQILAHYEWITKHPEEALAKARAAQEIFRQRFSLDRSLAAIYEQLRDRQQALLARRAPAQPDQMVDALLMLPEYTAEALDQLLDSFESQSHHALRGSLLVDAGDARAHAIALQQRLARCAKPVELKPVPFYERRTDGSLRRRLPLGQALAPAIEALPAEAVFILHAPNERWFTGHVRDLLHILQSKEGADFAFATTALRHVHKGKPVYDLLEDDSLTRNQHLPPVFGRFLFRRAAIGQEALTLMRGLDQRALTPLLASSTGASSGATTMLARIQEPFVTGELLDATLEQEIVSDRYATLAPFPDLGHIRAGAVHIGLHSSLQETARLTFQGVLLRLQAEFGPNAEVTTLLRQLRQRLVFDLFPHETTLAACEHAVARIPRKTLEGAHTEVLGSEQCDSLLAYCVALHHQAAGHLLEGIRALNRALANAPENFPAHYNVRIALRLAKLAIERGARDVALNVLQKVVLRIQPNHQEAQELVAKLTGKVNGNVAMATSVSASSNNVKPPAAAPVSTAPERVAAPTASLASAASQPTRAESKSPLVSAIVSTYKSERFMRACLDDLEAQTIADRLEIIVVDSNSPQNERAIVEEFQQRYPNIIYIRTEERESLYAAWNRAIRAARGKYITNANTDDRHRRDALEVLARTLDTNPDVTLVYADCLVTQTENATFDNPQATGHYQWLDFDRAALLQKGCFVGPQPMWRREAHDEHGWFDGEMIAAGDYEFWLRLARNRKFFHVRETLGLYLESPTSVEHANQERGSRESQEARSRHRAAILGNVTPPSRAPSPTAPAPAPAPAPLPAVAAIGGLQEARAFFGRRDLTAAWQAVSAALSLRPFHPEAYMVLAEIALAGGAAAEARRCGEFARKLVPEWSKPRQFLKSSLKGSAKPEWLVLPEEIRNPHSAIRNRLSVCLIVRNEEQFLEACLRSVKSVAHQIIVVDTGSTDRTVGIAKAAGAEVHSFTWCDDFAAARNEALAHATGDWVLSLDADEQLDAGTLAELEKHLRSEKVMAWRLPLVDHGREAGGFHYVPRLFRNAPGIHWSGRIHEHPFGSVEVLRRDWGLENKMGAARIIHFGYAKDVSASRDKIARNLCLLERALAENPDDANLLMNLGLELHRSGRDDEALAQYRAAFRALAALPAEQVVPELRETLLVQFTARLLAGKHFAESAEVLGSTFAKKSLSASLQFNLGLANMSLGRWQEAVVAFKSCLATRRQASLGPVNVEIQTGAPWHCLAVCLREAGQLDAAERAIADGLKEHAGFRSLQREQARVLLAREKPVEALQCLNELVATDAGDVESWKLGGAVALSRFDFHEFAADWTSEAMKLHASQPDIAIQRAEALLFARHHDEGAAFLRGLHLDARGNALLVLLEVFAGKTGPALSTDEPAVSRAFLDFYRSLVQRHAEPIVRDINDTLERLDPVLPTAAGWLRSVLVEAQAA